ncbi:MAG: zinc ribbon domain-containing protein [Calditrichaceae bacterium]|nr:zinc ribbon domain-containing protein [Calditrichaceae bacterium]MBN2710426.1 zinc ribbon domain-containing protein [Calditrichaceae bacterium]RQV93636.1 MAG: zinc ribbon domain-containing protein [Calditrichota bacterium]
MPTYEYKCIDCGYEFEVFQSMTADPITVCPKCKGKVQRRIGTGAGIMFKGSGFYITDYKKSKRPVDKKPESDSKKKGVKKAS